jgi:hypothetical protein
VKKKASPGTSRVDRTRAKSPGNLRSVRKGLSRGAVAVVRIDPRNFEVRVKGSVQIVGWIRKVSGKGNGYSYRILGETKSHCGFPSQKAAVERMLTKV